MSVYSFVRLTATFRGNLLFSASLDKDLIILVGKDSSGLWASIYGFFSVCMYVKQYEVI